MQLPALSAMLGNGRSYSISHCLPTANKSVVTPNAGRQTLRYREKRSVDVRKAESVLISNFGGRL